MKRFALFGTAAYILMTLFSCQNSESSPTEILPLIPKPNKLVMGDGSFKLNSDTRVFAEAEFEIAENFLRKYLQNGAGISLGTTVRDEAEIVFTRDSLLLDEAYELRISEEKIEIQSAGKAGAFYAVQSLRQLMDPQLEVANSAWNKEISIPALTITDAPKFRYRGMHLDVGRHFFPKEFIKEYISNLAMLKMNYFHWHLTEDQGWRIEIKQFPRLTEHAAFREETLVGHYNDTPQQFDGKRYGGFYTQDDIKEIVDFATEHNITIIPEIEMPGHAQAAISAYPELGCPGDPVSVATKWGVFETIYCPNQKTFAFLRGVLDEVCELFPGEYIHIGGDEAPKANWEKCHHCQKLIAQHDLGDENGLQSWFIEEIESYLNSKGKKIIGWDEILEGGLAPNATVMSWRGTQGAVEAAKEGHDVILTPTSHAYFDYYQSEDEDEPLAIGGFLPLKKVYSFNPIPHEMSEEDTKFVLGAQGNVWTEYMKTTDQVEYMVFPRIFAMSEVVWNGPSIDLETDYEDFLSRVETFMDRLKIKDVNAANHLYTIDTRVIKQNDSVYFKLNTPTPNKEIYYSINNGGILKYKKPFPITENSLIFSEVTKNGGPLKHGRTRIDSIHYHKGILASIEIDKKPHPSYAAGGKEALINGIKGSNTRYGDSEWLGFWGEDIKITLDLPSNKRISRVSTRFYHGPGQWIYAPKIASIEYKTNDGNTVLKTAKISIDDDRNMATLEYDLGGEIETSTVVLRVLNYGTIPQGSQGAGNKAWTFIDEIIIE
ncbi:MAG: family 20 glycosylhydrolase [Flavobacteriaceae bacterium]|nr:family 20 glycosylhydrolase [Flavobacteriaceae bacterium]